MRLAYVAIAVVLAGMGARAGMIAEFSDLGPAPGRPGLFYPGGWGLGGGTGPQVIASAFTAATAATLLDVVLALGDSRSTAPLDVYLESDDGSSAEPGSIMASLFETTILPGTDMNGGRLVTFACYTCPALAAGTQYWIVAAEPPYLEATWMFSNYDSGPSAYNLGIDSATGPWSPIGYSQFAAFEVYAETVPEPSSLLPVGAALLGFVGFRAADRARSKSCPATAAFCRPSSGAPSGA